MDLGAGRIDELLDDVAVAAGALVVDGHNGVVLAHLDARAQHAVHLLRHLGVAALHGVEVEVGAVVALHHAGGGAAAHADAVRGAAHLDDEQPHAGAPLAGVAMVHVPHAAGEHDGLDVLSALAAHHPDAVAARKAVDDGLAKLVAVVAGAVAGLDENVERRRQVGRVLERVVFPRARATRNVQVAHRVAGGGHAHQAARARGGGVADAAARARLRAREGRDAARKVVRLRGEEHVHVDVAHGERAGLARRGRRELRHGAGADGGGVVRKGDDGVGAAARAQRLAHNGEQVVGRAHAVDDERALEKPVARVLRVALRQVEELDGGGVAAQLAEHARVVRDVVGVEGEPVRGAELGERGLAARQHVHLGGRRGGGAQLEGREAVGVHALGHAVVRGGHERVEQRRALGARHGAVELHGVAARALQAVDGRQAARAADGDGVGRPRGLEVEARPHVHHARRRRGGLRRVAQALRLEGLGEQPAQHAALRRAERRAHAHVEHGLLAHGRQRGARPERRGAQPRQLRRRRVVRAVKVQHGGGGGGGGGGGVGVGVGGVGRGGGGGGGGGPRARRRRRRRGRAAARGVAERRRGGARARRRAQRQRRGEGGGGAHDGQAGGGRREAGGGRGEGQSRNVICA
ncbi:phosphoribosylformylglycinamidine synthase [Gracilaria domingensis]|nr:phosphoribosylformylglycinamidine synthase [Gracilaria domingensis]